jgi:hypothetical protein
VQTVPDVIQAKKFEVISEDGKAVVVLNSHVIESIVPTYEELHYGSITALNSNGRSDDVDEAHFANRFGTTINHPAFVLGHTAYYAVSKRPNRMSFTSRPQCDYFDAISER